MHRLGKRQSSGNGCEPLNFKPKENTRRFDACFEEIFD
jgi:hypothetical protein